MVRKLLYVGVVAGVGVCVFWFLTGKVAAQQDCYEDGTFGPTCAATTAPTSAPAATATLPPTSTPPAELPVSGSVGTSLAVFVGGAAFLLLGFRYALVRG